MKNIPESHRWKLCERKKPYSSEKNALAHLNVLRKKGIIIPSSAAAYKCFFGNHYHLGHKKV